MSLDSEFENRENQVPDELNGSMDSNHQMDIADESRDEKPATYKIKKFFDDPGQEAAEDTLVFSNSRDDGNINNMDNFIPSHNCYFGQQESIESIDDH